MRQRFITTTVLPAVTLLFVCAIGLSGRATHQQPCGRRAATGKPATTRITITVPRRGHDPGGERQVDPRPGTSRTFETPPIAPGRSVDYTFVATWNPNTYTTITRQQGRAGQGRRDLQRQPDGGRSERSRARHVRADAVRHRRGDGEAGGRDAQPDIVFEPGCGDARMTIAAVKAGAKKGVGIDIDRRARRGLTRPR